MIGEITAALSLGKGAMDSAKAVMRLAGEYDKIDLKMKAVELAQQVTELAQENMDLRQQLRTIQDSQKIRDDLIVLNHAYYRKLDSGRQDGPFCTRCFDVEGLLVRTVLMNVGPPRCENCIIKAKRA
jgi:hypothetical protein